MRNTIAKSLVVLAMTGIGMGAAAGTAQAEEVGFTGSTLNAPGADGGKCATVYTGRYQYDTKAGTTEYSLAEVDFNGISACS